MPGLIHAKSEEEKVDKLNQITNTYLLKDVKSLIKEENLRAFNMLLYFLAAHQGSIISTSSLAKEVGLSEPTVKKHLDILSETFVCYPLNSFSKNLSNELKKSKKYFLYDLGIRNMLIKNFSSFDSRGDKGIIGESIVFNALMKQLKPNMELRFWRTKVGDEVDFIVLKNQKPIPIEVKTTFNNNVIPTLLKKFISAYPTVTDAYLFCLNNKFQMKFNNTNIHVLNWLDSENLEILKTIS